MVVVTVVIAVIAAIAAATATAVDLAEGKFDYLILISSLSLNRRGVQRRGPRSLRDTRLSVGRPAFCGSIDNTFFSLLEATRC